MTDTTKSTTQLLTATEQDICQKIVVEDVDVAGQRAATLLAINDGATQAEASEQTGLTLGQIRYLLTTFRKKGLAIFPDDILSQAQSGDDASSEDEVSSEDGVTQAPAEPEEEKKTKKAKKSKKDKGKKSKKGKGKDKKDKKKKKGKKSKKGKGKKAGKKKSKK